MRLLLLAHTFPPFNASGSVRAAKLAEFFHDRGHDVRVLSGQPLPFPQTLPTSFAKDKTIATPWLRVEAPVDFFRKKLSAGASSIVSTDHAIGNRRSWPARSVGVYRNLLSIPDAHIGWLPYAVKAGIQLAKVWRPELIYSTALPFTSHIVAARLSRKLGCPWVGEYRDLFSGNPYNDVAPWRDRLNARIERRVTASASAFATVSPPMTAYIEDLTGKPCVTVRNGYDPADFAKADLAAVDFDPAKLTIVYTGILYPGRRDPAALFAALNKLGERRQKFDVRFYGPGLEPVAQAARAHGVADVITVRPAVPYLSALGLQKQADLLLLLLWDDKREKGVFTGKLFEYSGAGRPIISVGCNDGVAADLIRSRGLGFVANGPDDLAAALDGFVEEKSRHGRIKSLPRPNAASGLTRVEQFSKLEQFLTERGILRQVS